MIQNSSVPLSEVNISVPVVMDTMAVLRCPHGCAPLPSCTPLTRVVTTWKISLRDKPSCTKAYRSDTDETKEINCTDDRITWVSRPEENPDLQIGPVAISHDGYYKCTIASVGGNFLHEYHLQVLVPPEVTLFLSRNRTVVCKAVAGKPAAHISWTPERDDCDTKEDYWANGTVTVQSTCAWEDPNVTAVTCSVSHLTGNKSLCKKLLPDTNQLAKLHIIIILIVLILIIVGPFGFLTINCCRKCKVNKTEASPVFEEDEMQPYASYTEKNNPLYDTTNKVKVSQELQNEVDLTGLHTL
ncbi:cell surface glycoprotein CD200 receptor 1-like isoform X2 [Nycticebus coucang]|nr:cell surface glycoprotein CD200 receptor 1-like isoform X2 [Nycticebus coucang]